MTPVILRALRCAIPLWICAAAPLLADVTIRYQTDFKMAPFLPPQAREQVEKSMQAAGKYTLCLKNGKGWAKAGVWTSIIDFTTKQMTLLDPEHQTLSTVAVADLPDKMAALMPQIPEDAKKAMAAMKTSFDSKKTGRTDTIQGIQAEEREMVLSIEMPMPSGAPQPAMKMKMVMQIWTAKPEEALRNQAIRELMGANLWANYFMNPAAMLQKMTASFSRDGRCAQVYDRRAFPE